MKTILIFLIIFCVTNCSSVTNELPVPLSNEKSDREKFDEMVQQCQYILDEGSRRYKAQIEKYENSSYISQYFSGIGGLLNGRKYNHEETKSKILDNIRDAQSKHKVMFALQKSYNEMLSCVGYDGHEYFGYKYFHHQRFVNAKLTKNCFKSFQQSIKSTKEQYKAEIEREKHRYYNGNRDRNELETRYPIQEAHKNYKDLKSEDTSYYKEGEGKRLLELFEGMDKSMDKLEKRLHWKRTIAEQVEFIDKFSKCMEPMAPLQANNFSGIAACME